MISRLDGAIIAFDGAGGRVILSPDGVVGRYRAEHAAGNGCRAVIEEREGRIHLWRLALHFERLK